MTQYDEKDQNWPSFFLTCVFKAPDGGAQLVLGGIEGHGDDGGFCCCCCCCSLLDSVTSSKGLLASSRPPRYRGQRVGDPG